MLHSRSDYHSRIQDSANLIPADEPVVLLRAQDSCAVPALTAWLDSARAVGVDDDTISKMSDHILLMRAWPKKKKPDLKRKLRLPGPDVFEELRKRNANLTNQTCRWTVAVINEIMESARDPEFDVATQIGSDTIMLTVSSAGKPQHCYEIRCFEVHELGL